MSYNLATAVSPITQTIPRFMARHWGVNGPSSAKFGLTSTDKTDTTALQYNAVYSLQNDFIGVEWFSKDFYNHPLLSYAEDRDYSNVILSFSVTMDPNSQGIGEANGPTLIAETYNTPGDKDSGVAIPQFLSLSNCLPTQYATSVASISDTDTDPAVITTSTAHGLAVGDKVRLSGVTGNTNLNTAGNSTQNYWVVQSVGSATTFTVADPSTPTTALVANGTAYTGTISLGIFRANVSINLTSQLTDATQIDHLYLSFVPYGYTVSPSSPGILFYPLTITGATDDSPSVLTASGPHWLAVGQIVTISGVTGNTAVNGTWAVATVGPDTAFTLKNINTGSAVNGNGSFGGSPVCSAYHQLTSQVNITNLAVSGTGTLVLTQGAAGARPHNLRMAMGYDNDYNRTPAEVMWNYRQLGYRGMINVYTGAGHQFSLRLIRPSSTLFFQIDPTDGNEVNAPALAWFKDFYIRATQYQMPIIVSLSFELPTQFCDLTWMQYDSAGNVSTTGYQPPTSLIDPCNATALDFQSRVFKAHLAILADLGAQLIFQVGEPWIWVSGSQTAYTAVPFGTSGYVAGNPTDEPGSAANAPCVYGGSVSDSYGMLYAIKSNKSINPNGTPDSSFLISDPLNTNPGGSDFGAIFTGGSAFASASLDTNPLATVPDNSDFPGITWLAFCQWWRNQMGGATVALRNAVKAAYPAAQAGVLWYPPQVLGSQGEPSGLMAYINYCYPQWERSNTDASGLPVWDYIQAEDYGWITNAFGVTTAPDLPRHGGASTPPLTVTAATNATPAVITTSTPHGMLTGDVVKISGAAGNTAINGTWGITKVSATTFKLFSVTTGAGVNGNGALTGTATANQHFWALPDGNDVSGLIGIFRDALGYPIGIIQFFSGAGAQQAAGETDSQFAQRNAATWLNIYVFALQAFDLGYGQVFVWADSEVLPSGFTFQGAPPVANLQVTGFPTVPSGKVLSQANLSCAMLGDYADGSGTRYARQQFGAWDATNNCWKPAGEPDGVPLYIPGANQGSLYPPVTQFSYTMVFSDGTRETSEFNQQVVASALTPGTWSFGTAPYASPTVNQPVGYQSFFLPEGYNISGVEGAWDSTNRSDGSNYFVDLLPLIPGGDGVLAPGFTPLLTVVPNSGPLIPVPPIYGWIYDTSVLSTIGGRIEILSGYRPLVGERLSLFVALM